MSTTALVGTLVIVGPEVDVVDGDASAWCSVGTQNLNGCATGPVGDEAIPILHHAY